MQAAKVDRVTQPGTYTVAVKGVDANGYTGTKEIQLSGAKQQSGCS